MSTSPTQDDIMAASEAGATHDDIRVALAAALAEIERLRKALETIKQYGNDTLSGPIDGPDDRAWHREGVRGMTLRARAALRPPGSA